MCRDILERLSSLLAISSETAHWRLAPVQITPNEQMYCDRVCGLIRSGMVVGSDDRKMMQREIASFQVIRTILQVAIEHNRIDAIDGVFNNFILGGRLSAGRRNFLLTCFLGSNAVWLTALRLNNANIFQHLIIKFIGAYDIYLRDAIAYQSTTGGSTMSFFEAANQLFQQLLLISAARKDQVACAQLYQYPHSQRAIEPIMDLGRRAFIDPEVQNIILAFLLPKSPQDVASEKTECGNKQLEEMLRQSLFAQPQVAQTTPEEMERIESILKFL